MSTLATVTPNAATDSKIVCQIDGGRTHSIALYLREKHPDWTLERYQEVYPDAPILSEAMLRGMAEKRRARAEAAPPPSSTLQLASTFEKRAFHEVFELGNAKAARRGRGSGDPLMIDIGINHPAQGEALVPVRDPNYVFPIEDTKDVIIALQLGIPCYVWGYHGTGKTTLVEQAHARTRRSMLRVQHTINTEEADIVGQWIVRDGNTVFQPGPLTMAMIEGWTYLADEYDFAAPSVTAVYQPVLEGKPLVIKNAPPEMRVVRPHPNFRFFATGNTNGIGDESGLYQGTQMGNAANYSRFGITIQIDYMSPKMEANVVANQSSAEIVDAEKIVEVCTSIRKAYKAGQIGSTISPREAINTAIIGMARANWRAGFERAYMNRLSRVDREVVEAFAKRVWG